MWDRDKLIVYIANQMLNQGQQAIATILKIPIEKCPYHPRNSATCFPMNVSGSIPHLRAASDFRSAR
jgi:hypothetical protein